MDYSKFKKALQLLEEQNNRLNSISNDYEEWVNIALKESIIQRFETCWDCLWKILKRYLEHEIGLAEVPNGPKPLLRLADENYLLPSPISKWIEYNRVRIATSHDYSGEKAADALEIIDEFVEDSIDLYKTLSKEDWK